MECENKQTNKLLSIETVTST